MLKNPWLLFLFFLSPFLVHSQILNIERLRLEKDTAKNFMVKATVGLNANNRSAAETEPAHLFGFNFDINTLFYPQEHAYIFVSKFDYLKVNEVGILNFGYFHGRANYLRDQKINYETFIQYSFDNFRGLDPRWIFGGGIRHDIIKSEKTTFLIGIGGMYEYEKWRYPHTRESLEVGLFKSSNYLSFQTVINKYIDLNLVNYYQVGYDKSIEGFRNRISSSLIINAKLTERFSLTNSFDLAYEDKPVVPITKLIYSIKTGMSLDF
ncbi:MAG: DUF481 domain-containing protein [Anditalea sp.]